MLKIALNIMLIVFITNITFPLSPLNVQGTWVNLDDRPNYGLAIVLKKK